MKMHSSEEKGDLDNMLCERSRNWRVRIPDSGSKNCSDCRQIRLIFFSNQIFSPDCLQIRFVCPDITKGWFGNSVDVTVLVTKISKTHGNPMGKMEVHHLALQINVESWCRTLPSHRQN